MRPRLRNGLIVAAVVGVVLAAWIANARYSNGVEKRVFIDAGTNADGTMFYRCVTAQSTTGICTPGNQTTLTVDARDRLTLTVRSLDGPGRTHDFRLEGWPYAPPYPWVEMELEERTQEQTFTAWKAGSWKFICELEGHEGRGMWGTLVVKRT